MTDTPARDRVRNREATVSLIFALVAIPLFFTLVFGILAVVFAPYGLANAARSQPHSGMVRSIIGLALGATSVVVGVIALSIEHTVD